jgi:TPR repeat protein
MFQSDINFMTAIPLETSDNPDALFDLGMLYSSGRMGMVDLVSAHKWFNLAALKGRRDAIEMRREVAGMMSDVEIAMAQRAARDWAARH